MTHLSCNAGAALPLAARLVRRAVEALDVVEGHVLDARLLRAAGAETGDISSSNRRSAS